ncbi:MAG: hypothetical protein JXX28_10405 [Deltaproteobacteria bacterium]|nr:hypothetical protein [Deltaproteobacteria bacterium]
MRKYFVMGLLLPLAGCEYFDQGKDIFEGLTNPLVVQGMILGVEPPESEYIDLSQTDFKEGTLAMIFLADASNVEEIDQAPVEGAQVSLMGDVMGDAALNELGAGAYALTPEAGVTYAPGAAWTLNVAGIGDTDASVPLALPQAVALSVPEQHTAGEPLVLDLSGGAFDSALVVVLDGSSGEVTYSNEPQDVRAYYDFTHGSAGVGTIEIPGTAFPGEAVYAVGVAGMNNGDSAGMAGMNTVLSAVMVGKMVFAPVSTMTMPAQ